jgi:hypothetical protein
MTDNPHLIHQAMIQEVRFMDDRYREPIVEEPGQSSLFKKTSSAIINFFEPQRHSDHN